MNKPDHAGFYWVKIGQYKYDGIARVYGESPFFRCDIWDSDSGKVSPLENLPQIVWGEEIKPPA